jgi:hypothetical protein
VTPHPICYDCKHYRKEQHYCCADHQQMPRKLWPLWCGVKEPIKRKAKPARPATEEGK